MTTLLGGKINLNCSTNQPSEEITMVKWSRSNRTMMTDIVAYSANHRLFKFLNDDRITNSSSDGTCLQIQPAKFADDGNYTCEISAHQGVFRKHFFLTIIGKNTNTNSPYNSYQTALHQVHKKIGTFAHQIYYFHFDGLSLRLFNTKNGKTNVFFTLSV